MEELIMVPDYPEKLSVGTFLQKKRNGQLLPEFRITDESAVGIYPKMGFEWQPVQPYIVSDDDGTVDDLYAFLIDGRWAIAMFDELLGHPIQRVVKVVREPENIDYDMVKFKLKIK